MTSIKNKKQTVVHKLSILNPPICPTYTYIKNGTKTVEGRKYSPKYQCYRKGDILTFTCDGEELHTRITYIHKYQSVEDYLKGETLKKTLPCVKTIEEGVKIYNLWTSAKEREQLKKIYGYAFIGIGIERLTPQEIKNLLHKN